MGIMGVKLISPKGRIDSVVEIPGSKSYTQRAFLIASLAEGESNLANILTSEDTEHMIEALRKFGVRIEIDGSSANITGKEPRDMKKYSDIIEVGNAGTAMRFLTSFCSLGIGKITLDGNERMRQRPIGDLVDALENLIIGRIRTEERQTDKGIEKFPPVHVDSYGLAGGRTSLNGGTSSQYLSSILMVAPYAAMSTTVNIVGELTSKPYVDMTMQVMGDFGVRVFNDDYTIFFVESGQRYKPREYRIESDASNASYFMAAAAITGGRVKINKMNPDSKQGDIKFTGKLEEMGCRVEKGPGFIEVYGPEKLRAIEADMNSMPDVVQTLAVLAAVADGTTRIRNIGNLKVKETDRIAALETELRKAGIRVESTVDSITVYGGTPAKADIDTYKDHRMAMSFAVLGLHTPMVIQNPECVKKSFPDFWERFERIGP